MTLYHPERLADCDPDLIRLFVRVGEDRDCLVLQGARTAVEEQADMAAGRSQLKTPLDSLHVTDPILRPLALAADVAPYPINWTAIADFTDLATSVKVTALNLGIGIQWGGDWTTLKDYDHFQLVHPHGTDPTTCPT